MVCLGLGLATHPITFRSIHINYTLRITGSGMEANNNNNREKPTKPIVPRHSQLGLSFHVCVCVFPFLFYCCFTLHCTALHFHLKSLQLDGTHVHVFVREKWCILFSYIIQIGEWNGLSNRIRTREREKKTHPQQKC